MIKQFPVCSECNSSQMRRDATVEWNHDIQFWEIVSVQDAAWCNKCDKEVRISWEIYGEQEKKD